MRLLCTLGVHEWKRVYIGPKSCEAREKCVHRGAPGKTVGPVHKWEWIERTPCIREQVCARCGATGQVEEREHTWEWVERSPCVREQICRRCGTVGKTEKKEHQWKRDYHLQVETIEGWPLGPAARSIRLHLPSFTVIGTSSRPSRVNESLRSLMFVFNFEPYEETELAIIILSAAQRQGIEIVPEAAILLARYSDGNPSQGLNLLKKAHMYAIVRADGRITPDVVENASTLFELDDAPRAAARQRIPDDVKRFVWQRDGGRCVKCGSRENLEFDHIIPISKGGSNTARNIQLLCARCNRAKGANVA